MLNSRYPGVTETIVSLSKLPKLLALRVTWYAYRHETGIFYAVADTPPSSGKKSQIRLHRFITECSDNQYVLHLDNDGLNNTDENLVVTNRNRTGAKLKRELDYGVGFDERRLMWYAVVEVDGQKKTVGYFLSEKEANDAFEQMKLTTDV